MMGRLPEPIRSDVVKKITDYIHGARKENGFLDAGLLSKRASELNSKLAKISKRAGNQGVHISGTSREGVPGVLSFVIDRILKHVEQDQVDREMLLNKLRAYDAEIAKLADMLRASGAHDALYSVGLSGVDKWLLQNPPTVGSPVARDLAEEIVAEFESWPRLYDFFVALPFPRAIFEPIFSTRKTFSDDVRIEILNDRDFDLFSPEVSKGKQYVLRVAMSGYKIDQQVDGRIEAVCRQLLGLAIAVGLIDCDPVSRDNGKPAKRKRFGISSVEIGLVTLDRFAQSGFHVPDAAYCCEDELPDEESGVINDLTLPNEYGGLRLSETVDAWLLSDSYSAWSLAVPQFQMSLHQIGDVFRKDKLPLMAASEWLFGSYAGTNEALQMIQAITAIETLYGDKAEAHKIGTTELLARKCSSALGLEQYDEFKELYDARCDIVHEGNRRLKDESYLHRARNLAKKAIKKELPFMALQEPSSATKTAISG